MAPLTAPQDASKELHENWLGGVAVGANGAVVLAVIVLDSALVLQPLVALTR